MATTTAKQTEKATDPKATATAADAPEETVSLLDTILAKSAGDRSTPERQILRAAHLERERSSLMERIGKNRDYLRLMADNEELAAAEAEWVNTFYPEKEKGERRSADEIEATRKSREAARKIAAE